MLMTVQQLSQIPIKVGYKHYKIIPRIINRWAKKGKIKGTKNGNKYYIDNKEFIEYARLHYYTRKRKHEN